MSTSSDFLSFPCKRTDRLDIKTPISRYVMRTYGQEQAEDMLLDVEEVMRRRTETVAVSGGGPSEGAKEILASYYRALAVMETRFPVSRDTAHVQLPFYWMHAMNLRKKCKQMNIHFEKASVLFNIGAHLSQQAVQQNRESQEGYKLAIQYFQEAAAVFGVVREVALKVENPKPSDLSADFLMMAEKLMLAQGQECVCWKAMKDQKSSPTVLGRVTKQTSILYAESLGLFASAAVREDLDRTWQDLVQSKSWLFEALCQHHAAMVAKSTDDISTEISRLNQAVMLLEKLQKNGKFMTQSLPTTIREVVATASNRLRNAERDNASVYLKRILPFNELPVITGAQLVKIGEVPYLDASKEHIFADLIPEPITKALSRYADMVDTLIRRQTEKLNGATDEARLKLKQYELPEILDAVTAVNPSLVPEGLKKELREVDECGGLPYLEDIMQQLQGLKTSSLEDLVKIEAHLDQDAAQDSELREKHRGKWTTPSTASQTVEFRKVIGTYKENYGSAEKSDRVVIEKLGQRQDRFAFLSVEKCAEHLPKLEAGMVNTSDLEPQTLVANLRNSLEQMSAVSDERAGLDESLKETKNQDNLLPKLSATGVGSHEELFKEELKKYNEFVMDAEENMKKQQELLNYIRTALDDFKRMFDVPAWKQKVDAYCRDAKADIAAFYDIQDNLGEGMRFYMNLRSAVDTLKQQVADYILSRKLDRDDRLEMIKTQEVPEQSTQSIPSEQTVYTPPVSVASGSLEYTMPPPPPPEALVYAPGQSLVQAQNTSVATHQRHPKSETVAYSYGYGAGSVRADSGYGSEAATAPSERPSTGYSQHLPYDAMVDSPNPYIPPPTQSTLYDAYQSTHRPPPGQHPPHRYNQPPPSGGPPGYGYQGYGYQGYQSYAPPSGQSYAPPSGPPPASYQECYRQNDHYHQVPPHEVYSQQQSYDPYRKLPQAQGYPPQDPYGHQYHQQQPYDPYQKLPQAQGYPPQDPYGQQPPSNPYPGHQSYQNQ